MFILILGLIVSVVLFIALGFRTVPKYADSTDGARMKGVNEFTVTLRHALRNSLIPVVTGVSTQLGTILGGAVTVETVFSWPGMGTMLVTAAKQRDFPTVQYGILLVAISVTLVNILVDISYGYLDPRIREDFK